MAAPIFSTVGLLRYDPKTGQPEQGHVRIFRGSYCEVKDCCKCLAGGSCFYSKKVAVKRILDADAVSIEREEIALRTLNHPNIIKLYRVESDPNYR